MYTSAPASVVAANRSPPAEEAGPGTSFRIASASRFSPNCVQTWPRSVLLTTGGRGPGPAARALPSDANAGEQSHGGGPRELGGTRPGRPSIGGDKQTAVGGPEQNAIRFEGGGQGQAARRAISQTPIGRLPIVAGVGRAVDACASE